jgi:hypothetical protein
VSEKEITCPACKAKALVKDPHSMEGSTFHMCSGLRRRRFYERCDKCGLEGFKIPIFHECGSEHLKIVMEQEGKR